MSLGRKLRYGMVGGGPGVFIGAVHRMAAALDGSMEPVAGIHVICDKPMTKHAGRCGVALPPRARKRPRIRAHAQLYELSDG